MAVTKHPEDLKKDLIMDVEDLAKIWGVRYISADHLAYQLMQRLIIPSYIHITDQGVSVKVFTDWASSGVFLAWGFTAVDWLMETAKLTEWHLRASR